MNSEMRIQRERSRKVLNTGASVLVEFQVCYPIGTWMCSVSPTWKLSEPLLGLWRLHYTGMID